MSWGFDSFRNLRLAMSGNGPRILFLEGGNWWLLDGWVTWAHLSGQMKKKSGPWRAVHFWIVPPGILITRRATRLHQLWYWEEFVGTFCCKMKWLYWDTWQGHSGDAHGQHRRQWKLQHRLPLCHFLKISHYALYNHLLSGHRIRADCLANIRLHLMCQ